MLGCPFCGKTSAKARQSLGKRLRCGGCKGVYKLPAVAEGRVLPVEGPAQFKRPQAKPPSAFSPRRIIGGLAGLVPLLALGGVGWWWYNNYTLAREAEEFNDRIVAAHDAVVAKWDRCMTAYDFAVEAKDPYDLKKAAGEFGDALDDADRAARNLKAPDGVEGAAFLREFQTALDAHRLWLDGDLAGAIALFDRKDEPEAELKRRRGAFDEVMKRRIEALDKAQRKFAERYNLKLR